jgi:nucleoside-diphosphate-sugar epimerase
MIAMLLVSLSARRVAVTGAGGQTGQHAFRKLLANKDFAPIGIVRSEQSRAALIESGVPSEAVVVADVTDAAQFAAAIVGCEALIIGTSAKPAPSGATDPTTGRPIFTYPKGTPEIVDWLGQKAQIDAAKACGPNTHVIICSSMGGTDPSNMLNALGREKRVDRIAVLEIRRRHFRPPDRLQRPQDGVFIDQRGRLLRPLRTLVDPRAEEADLCGRERVAFTGRRHLHLFIQTGNILDER